MPRKLKPWKTDTVHNHKKGLSVDVMFDRNEGAKDFFAEIIPGLIVRDGTEAGCKAKVREAMSTVGEYEWQQIIIIKRNDPNAWDRDEAPESAGLGIEYGRHEIAKVPYAKVERYVERPFYDPTEDEWREEDLATRDNDRNYYTYSGPTSTKEVNRYSEQGVVLPYTPNLWRGLAKLAGKLNELRDELAALLLGERGPEFLLAVFTKTPILVLPETGSTNEKEGGIEDEKKKTQGLER